MHLHISRSDTATGAQILQVDYHYAGGVYGDVDMPVQPLDEQIINAWAPQPAPAEASSINVSLVNISGVSHKAATIGDQLAAAGFRITGTSTGPVPATNPETIIRYHPGSITQAIAVLQSLAGAVTLHPDGSVADGTITIDVGSALAVNVGAPQPTGSPSAPTTMTATSAPAPTTVPTAGGQPPSSSTDQPQSYDPTAC